jgi:DMSO/TMAO reductase YedYZ molybdopterin-dependent catalytic subunit
MNIEDEDAAIKPDSTHCVEEKPIDETPDLKENKPATEGSSTLPEVETNELDEGEAHDASIDPEEPQLTALELPPPVEAPGKMEQQFKQEEAPSEPIEDEASPAEEAPSIVEKVVSPPKVASFFQEQLPETIEAAPHVLRHWTRRDVLLFGAAAVTALVGGGALLPQATLERLGVLHGNKTWPRKEWLLNRALRIDDDVAEALYSPNRMVPTYTKSQITPLRNNYNGATPDPSYIPEWHLTLGGLASGISVSLNIRNLLTRFQVHEQITRLVCVEGWSAIAGWAGLRFGDLLQAFPPVSQAKWVRVESSVNLDPSGNPDPYFVSLDIPTADHPQTLLATHFNGQPLTVDHGAPLRLLVPMKLGLKNVKAITRITYMKEEPKDYWAERGYSRYDGI